MKEAFRKIGKSYAVAAAEIGCSKPRLVAVINHGEWPKKGAAGLRESLKQYFETNGADIPQCLENEPEGGCEMSAFWNWFVQASCWQVLGNALTLALALVIIGIGIGEAVRYIRISWKG